jgi:hypothetical protein
MIAYVLERDMPRDVGILVPARWPPMMRFAPAVAVVYEDDECLIEFS